MLNRADLTGILNVDVRALVGCADATDDQETIKLACSLEQQLPFLASHPTSYLEDLVLTGAELARALWRDADEDASLADLFAAEETIRTERRHLDAQEREGLVQLKLSLDR